MSDRGATRCRQPANNLSREMHNPGAIYSTTLCYNGQNMPFPKTVEVTAMIKSDNLCRKIFESMKNVGIFIEITENIAV